MGAPIGLILQLAMQTVAYTFFYWHGNSYRIGNTSQSDDVNHHCSIIKSPTGLPPVLFKLPQLRVSLALRTEVSILEDLISSKKDEKFLLGSDSHAGVE